MNKAATPILVLDDDPFMLKVLTRMLAQLGYGHVVACEDGAQALLQTQAPVDAPELIFLDLNMPHMDGIEFLRCLVTTGYRGSLIIASGEDERLVQMVERLVRAHNITILGYLGKPLMPAALEALMRQFERATQRSGTARKRYSADELRAAIRNGELVNYYQPKVEVASGLPVGAEALVRWQHPRDGLVGPDQFIPLAEENGLIDELTHAVMVQAMAQCAAWKAIGIELRISVNISMENLAHIEFADFVSNSAAAAGVGARDIVLEVTESRLMSDRRAPLDVLARLQLKRFGISIDDFGTGHSSLAQLHDIAYEELKIDQSFVRGAWHDESARAIYDASLALGKRLGMSVVAEGVEGLDEWRLLRRSACDIAQGYFISRPLPPERLPHWLAEWRGRKAGLLAEPA